MALVFKLSDNIVVAIIGKKTKHFSDHVHSRFHPATQQWASVGEEKKRGRATPQQRHPQSPGHKAVLRGGRQASHTQNGR